MLIQAFWLTLHVAEILSHTTLAVNVSHASVSHQPQLELQFHPPHHTLIFAISELLLSELSFSSGLLTVAVLVKVHVELVVLALTVITEVKHH